MDPKKLTESFLAITAKSLSKAEQSAVETSLLDLLEVYQKQAADIKKMKILLNHQKEEIFQLQEKNKKIHKAYKLKVDAFDNIQLNLRNSKTIENNQQVQSDKQAIMEEEILTPLKKPKKLKKSKVAKSTKANQKQSVPNQAKTQESQVKVVKSSKNKMFDVFLILVILLFLMIEVIIFVR